MSRQINISKLTIAVVAVLIATVPVLAQTDSANRQSDSQATVVTADSSSAIALNYASKIENPFNAVAPTPTGITKKELSVSPTKLMLAMKQLGSNNFVKAPQATEFQVWNPAQQVQEPDTRATSPKRITFVPSSGQKLPE